MIKDVWTTEEILSDVSEQIEKMQLNLNDLFEENKTLHKRISVAICTLRKYANPQNWLSLNNHKSVYKGCGVKKATTALTKMNKLKGEK